MHTKKKLHYIFIAYWFLVTYIAACLIWWFIVLIKQNEEMSALKIRQLNTSSLTYKEDFIKIKDSQKRKATQYIGEGAIFFLLTMAGAIFLYRAVRKQLKISQQQQNFMIAITHELKTPIAIAKLNLETLQKRKLDESQQQRLIYNTLQEANRLNSLCNNLLLSSQMEAGAYAITHQKINLSELAENCVTDFKNRFPNKNFISAINLGLFIMGDSLLIEMAVNNLIDNAIKYTPKETSITIALSQNKEGISLQTKDLGKGIADSEKDKIFYKFYRIGNAATKTAKGTGLGLYLTKKIVAQHKASISVTNNIPHGAIFTIHFPIIKNQIST
jgi:two-component system sensor histidine kinase CiaH